MPDGPKDDDFIPGFPLTGFDIRTYGEDRLLLTVEVAPDETSFAKANRLEIPFGLDARQARDLCRALLEAVKMIELGMPPNTKRN